MGVVAATMCIKHLDRTTIMAISSKAMLCSALDMQTQQLEIRMGKQELMAICMAPMHAHQRINQGVEVCFVYAA